MNQSKPDSLMETVTNTAIGFVISVMAWHLIAAAYGIPMPLGENMQIIMLFTALSILRQYVLRRLFNGRTPWQALKGLFS